jgi:DNA polymerase-1
MRHILFKENINNNYNTAILIKETSFRKNKIEQHYYTPLINKGHAPDNIIALSLKYNEQGKAPVKLIKESLETILKTCRQLNTTTLIVADSAYFKTLTKQRKAEPHLGYILPCGIKGYEDIKVILTVNYQRLFYDPTLQTKIDMSIDTTINHLNGTHVDLGQGIIHKASYPKTNGDIQQALMALLKEPMLTCDIETFGLALSYNSLGTIAFAKSKHEGIAFLVCYDTLGYDSDNNPYLNAAGGYCLRNDNPIVIEILQIFFEQYKGMLVFHNGTYDIKHIIFNIFMKDSQDIEGLIYGLEVMYRHVDDTKIITYLATNSTSGNTLDLKSNAFEFTGNYAQNDIHDISLIPEKELLKYNLIDCLATFYVYEKNHPIMIQDKQLPIHDNIYIPSMKVITHMELIGMPMNYQIVNNLHDKLHGYIYELNKTISSMDIIKQFTKKQQKEAMVMANLLLKKKVKPIDEFNDPFNPNSDKQLQKLLYTELELPIIDKTDTGLPAVGGKTLKKLLNYIKNTYDITEEELQ